MEWNWWDYSHSYFFEMQFGLGFCSLQYPEIRAQLSGGKVKVVGVLTQEHLIAAITMLKCFHKYYFSKQTETLYSINLLSKVPGNWPLNNLLVFSMK